MALVLWNEGKCMTTPEFIQLHAIVHGRVQGVSFRYYTVREAQRLGITGWVRNRRNRTVEVLAEGTRIQLDALVNFLHSGPPSAQVTSVDLSWRHASKNYLNFDVRYATD